MKITESKLKRIIMEEVASLNNEPVIVTPEYLNSIIKEEFQRVQSRKRIQETARKLRRRSSRRRRR